ncbi:hypothetical protein Cni_G12727 [Canna indica]|uniref:Chlororespiratory reduction31 n=1 Tax=Canna indica TaxID=4628 RepID=A0AAQ3QC16_9LILI|nr:hypothetical protein Cni_G12727 [Canna indica]
MTNLWCRSVATIHCSSAVYKKERNTTQPPPSIPSMATSISIHTIQNPRLLLLLRSRDSTFLRGITSLNISSHVPLRSTSAPAPFFPHAKFDLSQIMGGRGLCNGEQGLRNELQRSPAQSPPSSPPPSPPTPVASVGDDAFEKELSGLTGGFPGGEKGLKKFIEQNPPPPKKGIVGDDLAVVLAGSKPKPPELPLFLPGMIVIVKNPKNPFHMYSGIVQRVTDGKAGVLFEGGNWDKLLTFNLSELERREKGPPMVNPKSPVLESIVQNQKLE